MAILKGPQIKFALLIATVYLTFSLTSASISQDQESSSKATSQIRGRFSLPKIFEFEYYKALFKKHYSNFVEHIVRQKLYLGRAFRAFISAVTYRHRKSSIYLAINQMSDWTMKEVEMVQMSREDALEEEDLAPNQTSPLSVIEKVDIDGDVVEKNTLDSPMIPVANLQDIWMKLEEISSVENRTKPGYREIYHELKEASDLMRMKRSATSRDRKLNIEDLIHEPKETSEISAVVPSNNPNYEPVELHSNGIDNDDSDLPIEDANAINNIPGIEFINGLLRATSNLLTSFQEKNQVFQNKQATEEKIGNVKLVVENKSKEEFIDHRETNCFFEPRDQGKCGSCYIFAPIALYEWFYCMATGSKVAFSEQYPIDCGPTSIGLKGCRGGKFTNMSKFVKSYGIELRKNYPYRRKNDSCPYEQNTPISSMGYLRISDNGFKYHLIDDVEEKLKIAPMVMNIKLHSKFLEYGGGVDDGFDCESSKALHSVVLIGSGREEGEDYWLIRNSHSVSWGESGYYRLSKKSHCLDPNKAFTLEGVKILAKHTNTKYTGYQPLKKRYSEYMKADLQNRSKKE